ncbi:MAG: cytochrome c-type biogenesis protein CcmH [Actinobacteria bacterium]|nr:cytochrome c-type biogenesis protein CcmH [Actinomycetota bacterium]
MKLPALTLLLLVVAAGPAAAAPEDLANEVSAEVMSPYCDGVTLHDCPSRAALELRDRIEGWARDGWSKSQIMAELEREFGPGIHATPQDKEGVAAWVLPAAALLVGVAVAAALAMRWTRRRGAEQPEPVDPSDHARVERELAALREETP